MMRSHYIFTQLLLCWVSVGKKWVAERGGLDIFFCVYSRGFLLLHSPMDPATGWGIHGSLCVDMLILWG